MSPAVATIDRPQRPAEPINQTLTADPDGAPPTRTTVHAHAPSVPPDHDATPVTGYAQIAHAAALPWHTALRPPEERPSTDLPIRDPGRYDIQCEYARGGLGRILVARDRELGREVAVKQLIKGGSTAKARLVREARITARLEHPSIVPVHEAGRWPTGEPFYAMKMVSGRSLAKAIRTAPTLEERLALLPHVIAVADAIAYAHSQMVLHRDLKPSNVIVGDYGETVVIDWGLAKDLTRPDEAVDLATSLDPTDSELTVAGTVVGTPAYMPPEQARGVPVDERADIYALGSLLYHVLTGEAPYVGSKSNRVLASVLAGPPTPIEKRAPGLPADLVAIVHKAMARDLSRRYRSARALGDDLRRFQSGRLVSARRYPRCQLALRWLRGSRRAMAVGVAACLLFLLVLLANSVRLSSQLDAARDALRHAEQRVEQQAEQRVEQRAEQRAELAPREALVRLVDKLQPAPSGP